jgi:hypothetical protein
MAFSFSSEKVKWFSLEMQRFSCAVSASGQHVKSRKPVWASQIGNLTAGKKIQSLVH